MPRTTFQELLVVMLGLVGLGAVMFAPNLQEAPLTCHPMMLIGGILAVGGVFIGMASDWKIKRLLFAWPLYILLSIAATLITLSIIYPRGLSCAETLLR